MSMQDTLQQLAEGQTSGPADKKELRRRIRAAPKRGLLYEVKAEQNVVYVFGTIHAGKAEFYPLNLETIRALTGSAFFVVEADTHDQAAVATQMAAFAMLPPSSTLDQYVQPALMDKVTLLLDKYAFPKERAIRMKAWMLATTLATLEAKHGGYDPGWATEAFLLGLARVRAIPVVELEGLAHQFGLYNGLSDEDQLAFLQETVDGIGTGSVGKRTAAIADAWAHASAGDLEKLNRDLRRGQSNFARFFNTRMLDERNGTMAARIDEYLRSGKRHFVAVGVLHLVGDRNVIELLKERGYTIREM
jgi:uncharacterized protein YbaP (TraB family)